MSSKKNTSSKIDPEQRVLIERAQKRAHQKRRLYVHFILFLIGSVILILLNVVFDLGQDIQPLGLDWFIWAIIIWGLIFLLHAFNVFVTNRFFGKEWENRQVEILVAKQMEKIEELQHRVEKEHPIPSKLPHSPRLKDKPIEPEEPIDPTDPVDPDSPINS